MLRTPPLRGPAAPTFHTDARSERLFHEHRKLSNDAQTYAYAHPRLAVLGEDPVVDHLIASHGFGWHDLVALRLYADGRTITAICVPTRLWRDPDAKSRLLELKSEARLERTACVLVPQRWLRASIRGSVARTIARSRGVQYARAQADAVLAHLTESRISTIAESAACVRDHHDPMSIVLSLASQGFIELDRSAPLRAETLVSVARSMARRTRR